jgi:DNA mismatch repair protein MutL
VDQHALAERITFEQMRKQVKDEWFVSDILLQPITITYPAVTDIDPVLEKLWELWFDVSLFSEGKVIIHAVPQVLTEYKIDIELLMQFVWWIFWGEEETPALRLFDIILDEILGMKACKASIKAWQKLTMLQIQQLIQDGITHIDGMFVCQHGRPSVVGTHKRDIDELFDR